MFVGGVWIRYDILFYEIVKFEYVLYLFGVEMFFVSCEVWMCRSFGRSVE